MQRSFVLSYFSPLSNYLGKSFQNLNVLFQRKHIYKPDSVTKMYLGSTTVRYLAYWIIDLLIFWSNLMAWKSLSLIPLFIWLNYLKEVLESILYRTWVFQCCHFWIWAWVIWVCLCMHEHVGTVLCTLWCLATFLQFTYWILIVVTAKNVRGHCKTVPYRELLTKFFLSKFFKQ